MLFTPHINGVAFLVQPSSCIIHSNRFVHNFAAAIVVVKLILYGGAESFQICWHAVYLFGV